MKIVCQPSVGVQLMASAFDWSESPEGRPSKLPMARRKTDKYRKDFIACLALGNSLAQLFCGLAFKMLGEIRSVLI